MKILLRNGQSRLGDCLMFTPLVRDLKRQHPDWQIKVRSCNPRIWDNNPHLTDFEGEPDEIYDVGPAAVTQGSKTNGLHFTNGFRVCLEDKIGKPIRQGALKPEIFLSEYEKQKRIIDGKYWLVNIDCGPYDAKRWPTERWQEVVDRLPWIDFVQIGTRSQNRDRLRGPNVTDYVGKTEDLDTGLRDLFTLFYHAEGVLSLVSASMHIAGALLKPCVVIAGAREPVAFEQYQWHRYIHNIGSLPCAEHMTCWRCAKGACDQQRERMRLPVGEFPRCMEIIKVEDVIRAIESYYDGGLLSRPEGRVSVVEPRVMKVVSNGKYLGGAERSMLEVIGMAQAEGYEVELATRGGVLCRDIEQRLRNVKITNDVSGPCDVLMLYASDMVFDFEKDEFMPLARSQARRKVMALTYKFGSTVKASWTRGWDKYLFLSSVMEWAMTEIWPDAPTRVLPPPIDLEPFFAVEPNYSKSLRMMRHSSQGDNKYSPDINDLIEKTNAMYGFMPAPSFLKTSPTTIVGWPYNSMPVPEFLAQGNCFWYLLPEGYTDQGPRAIMEAMAAGLPVIAENRDGAKDRVTPETGWLVDSHDEAVEIINSLTPEVLERKGRAARERARTEFRKERWIEEILDEHRTDDNRREQAALEDRCGAVAAGV